MKKIREKGSHYPLFLRSPAMGTVLMPLSSIIVAITARFLKIQK